MLIAHACFSSHCKPVCVSAQSYHLNRKKASNMKRMLCLVLICVAMSAPAYSEPTPDNMEGFSVDLTGITEEQSRVLAPSLRRQLQIITSVNLPASMLAFFRTVPIVIESSYSSGSRALFRERGRSGVGEVHAGLLPLDGDKPVLLHEMMHAYDAKYWQHKNPEVNSAYQAALTQNLYAPKSHFMLNQGEFFAISATVYLYGDIAQVPYNCSTLILRQSNYVEFLEGLFGHHVFCDAH